MKEFINVWLDSDLACRQLAFSNRVAQRVEGRTIHSDLKVPSRGDFTPENVVLGGVAKQQLH